ncbi:hypothetical protein J23TS9_39460 [Paenibacillus sp. J23TS9]|uniref:hypothetical protein n=1 Tax=Paenibacillus sp. J23TS9 TaxID=2807193 RepID=UPI001B153CAD|nr:hypothetical protein J23TS9_39460 [Paenibacillus sp. J23TS9]
MNQIVDQMLQRSGLDITVRLEHRFEGGRLIGGKYGMISKTVTMYTEVIEEQCLQMFGSLEQVETYFAVVLAHELGHAADTHLPFLCEELEDAAISAERRTRVALQIEENAWNYALALVPEVDAVFFSTVIDESLVAYRMQAQEAAAEAVTA